MRKGHWELTGWRVPFLELRWTLNQEPGIGAGPLSSQPAEPCFDL